MDDFTRPTINGGWIEVIVGCMFSGKTEELIRRVRRAQIARLPTQIFKPRLDDRYSVREVASHNQTRLTAQVVVDVEEILTLVEPSTHVVGIDEGQFLGDELPAVASILAEQGKRVIVAGLDTDWRGRPFGPMPHLMAIAELVHKQHAICRTCGAPASRTQRLIACQDDVLVGATDVYEARCRAHFDPELLSQTLTDQDHSLV
ncbi:MAG: thymidine kinase [Bdellovibrionales bacterium]